MSKEREKVKVEKVIRDGKVAVLVSPGFGAGWSTWAEGYQAEVAIFDRRFVEAVESGVVDINPLAREIFVADHFCTLGWPVEIEWIDQGSKFTIEEYDGSESLRMVSDLTLTA